MKTNKISSYKDLIVWQKSTELVFAVYEISKKLPHRESYGLSSQIQRAAVAIPSNIAEGYARNHKKEFIQFLGIAFGSGAELETQVFLIKRLYPQTGLKLAESLIVEVQKMLITMIKKLKPSFH